MAVLLALLALFGFGGAASPAPPGGLPASWGEPVACPDVHARGEVATDVRAVSLTCRGAAQAIRDDAAGRRSFQGLACVATVRSGGGGEVAHVCTGREQQVTWTEG